MGQHYACLLFFIATLFLFYYYCWIGGVLEQASPCLALTTPCSHHPYWGSFSFWRVAVLWRRKISNYWCISFWTSYWLFFLLCCCCCCVFAGRWSLCGLPQIIVTDVEMWRRCCVLTLIWIGKWNISLKQRRIPQWWHHGQLCRTFCRIFLFFDAGGSRSGGSGECLCLSVCWVCEWVWVCFKPYFLFFYGM